MVFTFNNYVRERVEAEQRERERRRAREREARVATIQATVGSIALVTFPTAGALFLLGLCAAAAYVAISMAAIAALAVALAPTERWRD